MLASIAGGDGGIQRGVGGRALSSKQLLLWGSLVVCLVECKGKLFGLVLWIWNLDKIAVGRRDDIFFDF